jgi:PDZ domain
MNTTLVRPTLAAAWRLVLGLSIAVGLAWSYPAVAEAHGGGGGGGGHGGGMGGGFGGGHMGGGFGGLGGGMGHMGGGYAHHGGYGGYGGYGFGGYYPGFFGLGGFGLGYGLGYGGLGYGGYGYPGYGYGYGGYYPGYGLGYSGYGYYPGSSYGSSYYYPSYTYGTGYVSSPGSTYTYSSAYGSVPLQGTTSGAVSSMPLPSLGIDEKGVTDSSGVRTIEVTQVHPGSPAEKAGLQVGDTIVSVNGYLTQVPGNLAWIINHHAPGGVVTMSVRKAASGQTTTVTATLH